MSDVKHTPGPWRLGSRYESIVADAPTGWDDADNLYEYGGHMVCESVGTEANARLIAAAPDMLDALIAVFDAVDGTRAEQYAAMKKVEAAIAKAEGLI